jgi:hypothetical protein
VNSSIFSIHAAARTMPTGRRKRSASIVADIPDAPNPALV